MVSSALSLLALSLSCLSPAFGSPTLAQGSSYPTNDSNTFDYIVVGSGPGGGPLAVNLATAGYSVLLLEAGQNLTAGINQASPAFFTGAQWDEEQGWWFYVKNYGNEATAAQSSKMVWEKPNGGKWVGTNPPEGSTQLGIWYPRAGTLGGCDTHNGGLTVRPSNWDWDNIANLTGDESWEHENMLRYFVRLERNLVVPPGTPGHGFEGYQPVRVGDKALVENQPQVLATAQGAAAVLGYTNRSQSTDFDVITKRDINELSPDRDFQNDVYQISFKMDEQGRRYSSGSRVNDGVARGLPLVVRFNSLVTKVQIDDDLRATGVEYLEGQSLYKADPRATGNETGVPRVAKARHEVILSGGTFNTPQILLLSGIGPAEDLEKHDIPVTVDLPGVGKNLQDHYEVPVIQEFANNFTYWDNCTGILEENQCYQEWKQNGTGPWATLGFFTFVLHTSSVAPRGERDLIMYSSADAVLGHLPPFINYTELITATNVYTYTISESHSRNRAGTVTLRTSDPRDVPEINFEYFHDGGDEDIQGLIDGIEFTRKLFDAIPGENTTVGEAYPGRNLSSKEQLTEFIKAEAYGHHATGTAVIGSDDDPLAVLDSEYRVRGVKGLRVVDASIFPVTPGTFPLISVFMISEKASDVILAAAANAGVDT